MSLDPQVTYIALLVVQTAHLLHHRLAKRHISFTEVLGSLILCVPFTPAIPPYLYSTVHITIIVIQVVGSIWIERLSPSWETPGSTQR
jgi:hypothetical protein